MSNYYDKAIHPITGVVENALFIDDHFGRHIYGVMFSDEKIFRMSDVRYPPREEKKVVKD